jgi:hypothetical protein
MIFFGLSARDTRVARGTARPKQRSGGLDTKMAKWFFDLSSGKWR